MAEWPRDFKRGATTCEEYYFKKGGSVELALAYVIDKASHVQAEGGFADLAAPAAASEGPAAAAAAPRGRRQFDFSLASILEGARRAAEGDVSAYLTEEVPPEVCTNDSNYEGVFEALLGAQKSHVRRLQGCKKCGWCEPIDDFESTWGRCGRKVVDAPPAGEELF